MNRSFIPLSGWSAEFDVGFYLLDQDLIAGKVTYRSDREIGFLSARDNIRWNVTLIKNGISDDKADSNRGILVNGRVMDSNSNVLRRTEGPFYYSSH